MKRINILCAAVLAVFIISACAGGQSQMEYIGAAKAKELALAASGLSDSQVEFTMADLSERSGQNYYRVEFTALDENYSYDIDALTGVIIDAKTPAGSAKGGGDIDADADGNTQDGRNAADGADAGITTDGGVDTAGSAGAADGMITDQEAKARALAHAGLADADVTFVKSGLDYEDGSKVYELEFYTNDHKEYDYEIDALTGEIVSFGHDAESVDPTSSDGDSRISEQKAKELA